MRLLDAKASATLLGYSKEYLVAVVAKKAGFPAPVSVNGRGECRWREADLLAWQRAMVAARFKRAA